MKPSRSRFRMPAISDPEPFINGHRTPVDFFLGGEEADIARHQAEHVESPAEAAGRARANAEYEEKYGKRSREINKIIDEYQAKKKQGK